MAGSRIQSDICFEFCPVIRQKAPRFWTFFNFNSSRANWQVNSWVFTAICDSFMLRDSCAETGCAWITICFFQVSLPSFFPSANVPHFYLNRLNCSFWDTATFWKKEEALVRCVSLKTLKSQQQSKLPPVLTWVVCCLENLELCSRLGELKEQRQPKQLPPAAADLICRSGDLWHKLMEVLKQGGKIHQKRGEDLGCSNFWWNYAILYNSSLRQRGGRHKSNEGPVSSWGSELKPKPSRG